MADTFRPEDTYADDMRPCVVGRKKCGCYVAASKIDDPSDEVEMAYLTEFFKEMRAHGATIEFRPVRFIWNGGLDFNCTH